MSQRKQEADLSKDVDAQLPEAEALAKKGQLQSALDKLNVLEKKCRMAADVNSTSRTLISIASLCFEAKDLALLVEQLSSLTKKHGQLRDSVTRLVDHVMGYLDALQGEQKLQMLNVLRDISEGKVYLEVQRARLTRTLADIREHQDSNTSEASKLMNELQVETFGSMDLLEKTDFILEQMRLLRAVESWDPLLLASKKVNLRFLSPPQKSTVSLDSATATAAASSKSKDASSKKEESAEDKQKREAQEAETASKKEHLLLRYYDLMCQYALHEDKYLDLCRYYRAVADAPSIAANPGPCQAALRNAVFFVILAPYDNEQSDLLNRLSKDDRVAKMFSVLSLVKCFTTPELMRWPAIQQLYGEDLRRTKVFGPQGTPAFDEGDVQEEDKFAKGDKRWELLHVRVTEHNMRTLAKYYTRITMSRLSELLDLPAPDTESVVARLAVEKMIYAKMDRPAGTVTFEEPKKTEGVLNEWASDVNKLMTLIEKSSHLIARERAVAAAAGGPAKKPLKA